MAKRLLVGRTLGLVSLAVLLAPAGAIGGDARVLDSEGRVLTVGTFALVRTDGGGLVRTEDERILSWELHDADQLVAYGVVPGTEGPGTEAGPALSRDPARGDSVLVWSRQTVPGAPREIASMRFEAAPDPASLQIVASASGDQAEPTLIHDEAGWTYVAWVDVGQGRTVRSLAISPGGGLLDVHDLSSARSTDNSAPRLGIDAAGQLFAAFIGTDVTTGARSLYILAPAAQGGGVQHVPNPLIELCNQATLPTPLGPAVYGEAPGEELQLTVLGGTPVGWWTEVVSGNRKLFRFVAQGDQGWSASTVQTIDLSTGLLGSIPDALALVEARLRRVISSGNSGASPYLPTLPGGLARPRSLERR